MSWQKKKDDSYRSRGRLKYSSFLYLFITGILKPMQTSAAVTLSSATGWNQKYINTQDHCVTGFFLAISFNNMAYWVTISMLPVSLLQTNLSGKYLKVQKIGWPSFTVTQFRMLQLLGVGYIVDWQCDPLYFFFFLFLLSLLIVKKCFWNPCGCDWALN